MLPQLITSLWAANFERKGFTGYVWICLRRKSCCTLWRRVRLSVLDVEMVLCLCGRRNQCFPTPSCLHRLKGRGRVEQGEEGVGSKVELM